MPHKILIYRIYNRFHRKTFIISKKKQIQNHALTRKYWNRATRRKHIIIMYYCVYLTNGMAVGKISLIV